MTSDLMLTSQLPPPVIPDDWDYAKADAEFDRQIYKWRRLTVDVVTMLWIFYHKLKRQGQRTDFSANAEKLPTWLEWLDSKGIGSDTPIRHFRALGWLPSAEQKKLERLEAERAARQTALATVEIRRGDFKDVLSDIEDIDAIITDPPYPKEYLNCFSELADFAEQRLKLDGFLAVYSGQYYLPEVIRRLSAKLVYVWTFCLYLAGQKQIVNNVNIMCGWKPVVIFSRGRKKMRFSAYDVLVSEKMEKESHPWQQSQSGVEQLIEIFSMPGDLIVDPFAGSGTFGVVAQKMGRRFIGAEIDDKTKIRQA